MIESKIARMKTALFVYLLGKEACPQWVIDGATFHMCYQKKLFVELEKMAS